MTYLIGSVSIAGAAPWPQLELERQVARVGGDGATAISAEYVPLTGFPGVSGVIVGRYTRDLGQPESSGATVLTVYPRDGSPWVSAGFDLGPCDAVRVVGALGLGAEGVLPRVGPAPTEPPVDPLLVVEIERPVGGGRLTEGWLLSLADPARPHRLAAIEVAGELDPAGGRSAGWSADRYEVRRGDSVRELVVVGRDRTAVACPAPDQVRRLRITGRTLEPLPVQWVDVSCR